MKVSLNWLNELVDLSDLQVEQIAHELTVSGLEVEEIEEVKAQFTNIVTARIEKIDQHPNADKLHLVTINNGSGLKTVVCGGQNIEEGQIIPYASVGSKVLDRHTGEQFTLTPAKIRGVESEGMLCSDDELGVADRNYQEEDGILILNRIFPNVQPGVDVEELLGFEKDIVLNVAPTANRGDQFSVVGIARELSAIFNRPLKFSYLEPTKDFSTDKFKVEIKDSDVCKFYSIGLLNDIVIKPSPDWMQKRLVASGIRAINNVVDITNYVLLEYGTPLHAFDFDKIGNYLCVRRADDGEKIVTLDGEERVCSKETVLISTENDGVCIAGVFGGANSEVDENTKNIALEAAYFPSATTRKSARSVGYRSEASSRFEHGVDIEAVKPGLMRAMQLLVDFADAKIEGIVETGKGYVAHDVPRDSKGVSIDVLPIDATFMPIKRVSYNVENTRVGDSIDFDKLTLEIWSNGSIEVSTALSQASNLLIDHFMQIASITGQPAVAPIAAIEEVVEESETVPTMTIEELELSVRAYNCLKRASINSMAELLKKSEHDLLNIKNFGKKSSDEVIERLHHFGLDLAPNPEIEEEIG